MKLYGYQDDGVSKIDEFNGRAALFWEMGLGKTIVTLKWMKEHPEAFPVVVVCPASVKWHWQQEARKYFGFHSVVCSGKKNKSTEGSFKDKFWIINYDILEDWVDYFRIRRPKTIILDECFPWNTKVLTNRGWIPIGEIVDNQLDVSVASYDFQNSAISYKPILHYNRKHRSERMCKVTHTFGYFYCTENHKIWVEGKGYVRAKDLQGKENLRMVWSGVSHSKQRKIHSKILWEKVFISENKITSIYERRMEKVKEKSSYYLRILRKRVRGNSLQSRKKKVLQQQLFWKSENGSQKGNVQKQGKIRKVECSKKQLLSYCGRKGIKKEIVKENVGIKSYVRSKCNRQNDRNTRAEWYFETMERKERRKWTIYITPNYGLEKVRSELGIGITNKDRKKSYKRIGLSHLLQSRYRKRKTQNSSRNRWESTSYTKKKNYRHEKAKSTNLSRVESVEIYKHRSGGRFRPSSRNNTFVYNIEVKDNHNYFANGVLVSNCQYIKNHKSIRYRASKELCSGRENVIALSGTPLLNRPIELYTTLNILRPDVFKSRWVYAQRFCDLKRGKWGWDLNGSSNLDQLNNLLTRTVADRKRKSDVLKELPKKTRIIVPLPLKNRKEYERARDEFIDWLREQDEEKARRALRAQQLVKIEYLKQVAAKEKMFYVVQWINDFLESSDEKLIIFGSHRKMIEGLQRQCKAKSVVLDGSVVGNNRREIVNQFQNDKETRLFIGNTRAAGTGINLTAASTVVFTELEWQPGIHLQAESRPHRIGQTKPVFVYYLVAHSTIEERLCKIIRKKQIVITSVLDGKKIADESSVFDELMKEFKK